MLGPTNEDRENEQRDTARKVIHFALLLPNEINCFLPNVESGTKKKTLQADILSI